MSKGIRLSEKYGVNPTLCKCFFCGETKHIALLGHIGDRRKKEDIEAPKECIMDYEPCDKCQENMSMGVTLVEVSTEQPLDNRPPMKAQGDQLVYPLGRWCVVRPEAIEENFKMTIEQGQKCFVDTEIMDNIMSVYNK